MTFRSILARVILAVAIALALAAGGLGLLHGALTDPRPVE